MPSEMLSSGISNDIYVENYRFWLKSPGKSSVFSVIYWVRIVHAMRCQNKGENFDSVCVQKWFEVIIASEQALKQIFWRSTKAEYFHMISAQTFFSFFSFFRSWMSDTNFCMSFWCIIQFKLRRAFVIVISRRCASLWETQKSVRSSVDRKFIFNGFVDSMWWVFGHEPLKTILHSVSFYRLPKCLSFRRFRITFVHNRKTNALHIFSDFFHIFFL